MKQFLMGAAVATAVLGAAGFAVKKSSPLTVGELTLDRAVRYTFPCGPTSAPLTITAPPDQGFVFTYFGGKLTSMGVTPGINVSVNGGPTEFLSVGAQTVATGGAGFDEANNLTPPIILRPGESMTIGVDNGSTSGFPNPPIPNSGTITIGGYFVYPGEV